MSYALAWPRLLKFVHRHSRPLEQSCALQLALSCLISTDCVCRRPVWCQDWCSHRPSTTELISGYLSLGISLLEQGYLLHQKSPPSALSLVVLCAPQKASVSGTARFQVLHRRKLCSSEAPIIDRWCAVIIGQICGRAATCCLFATSGAGCWNASKYSIE